LAAQVRLQKLESKLAKRRLRPLNKRKLPSNKWTIKKLFSNNKLRLLNNDYRPKLAGQQKSGLDLSKRRQS
jgi:hypothetical protein